MGFPAHTSAEEAKQVAAQVAVELGQRVLRLAMSFSQVSFKVILQLSVVLVVWLLPCVLGGGEEGCSSSSSGVRSASAQTGHVFQSSEFEVLLSLTDHYNSYDGMGAALLLKMQSLCSDWPL